MIPRTITFDEIQQGDKVRQEWRDNGVLYTSTGTAQHVTTELFMREWRNAGRRAVARDIVSSTITLLDRPTTPLPQEQGAPIMIYAYRNPVNDRRTDVEIVAVRSGPCLRDMGGLHYEDHEILAWAPLVAGERVER